MADQFLFIISMCMDEKLTRRLKNAIQVLRVYFIFGHSNVHAQAFAGARSLGSSLKFLLSQIITLANNEGAGNTVNLRSLD